MEHQEPKNLPTLSDSDVVTESTRSGKSNSIVTGTVKTFLTVSLALSAGGVLLGGCSTCDSDTTRIADPATANRADSDVTRYADGC